MNDNNIKQVIVWRNDLKVRKGKFAAQVAHASIGALLKASYKTVIGPDVGCPECDAYLFAKDSVAAEWLNTQFTKIVVQVNSEQELLELHNDILDYNFNHDTNIPVALITDSGFTEFNGVPTHTCVGIGPVKKEIVDLFTGHLKLM